MLQVQNLFRKCCWLLRFFFFQTYFVRTGKLHCRCRVFQRVCDGWWSKPKQLQRGRLPAGLSSLTCWRVSWCIGFQCFRGPLKHHCRKSSLISLPFLGFTISHCVKGTTDTEVFRSFSMSKYQVSVQVGNFFVLAQIHPEISWSKQQTFFFWRQGLSCDINEWGSLSYCDNLSTVRNLHKRRIVTCHTFCNSQGYN